MREPDWYTARTLAADVAPSPSRPVPVGQSQGCTLAEAVRALTDLPGANTSAMDGWAVAGSGPWQVVGEVLAGTSPEVELQTGQAVVIATGAAVPSGTTAVLRTEHGVLTGDRVEGPARPGDLRPRGEECRAGDVLIPAGTVVGPGHIGLACAAGLDELIVRTTPRVSLLLFGDELVDRGIPTPGRVRDALGPQLPGWIGRLGGEVVSSARAQDTLQAHVAALRAADADIVMTTGGTAAGPVDHLHAAVAELGGRWIVDSVAVRPGHPMGLARLGDRWLVALPGNPQSAIVSLLTLGAPLIAALLGRWTPELPTVTLGADAVAPPAEHRLLACGLVDGMAQPVTHLGSAMLRGLAAADGFAVIAPGGASAGATVEWLALP